MSPLRGVIFDYGNTLVRLDPSVRTTRTDYADVVAGPGSERLAAFLVRERVLGASRVAGFVGGFLEVRERNRTRAEEEASEIPAVRSLRETLDRLGLTVPPEPTLERAVEEYFTAEVELIRPMPGAAELLESLSARGLRLAVLSNATSGRYVEEVVRRLGWRGMFDPFVVSADIGIRKPRPEAFRSVLDRWDFEPREIAMVGDSLYHDVEGAQALGLVTIHLTAIPNSFDAKASRSAPPTHSVGSLAELRPLLS
jgi:HAD superfamily hydrolase (TIGR01509 family)